VIHTPSRLRQAKDFRNLLIDGFTPTDIDFAYDKDARQFVFGELKVDGTQVPEGQMRMLKGLSWALASGGRQACILVASHNTLPTEDIDVGNLLVVESWHTSQDILVPGRYVGRTVSKACDDFFKG